MRPIIIVVGARPNFMKMAPLYSELKRRKINTLLLHTGQHYDKNMSSVFFDELGMPKPDIYLGVGSDTHAKQTAKIMVDFEVVCLEEKPQRVIVAGDVNSTIACALVATKLNIPVDHVEAGLRSFDMDMPEEINRILTDRISSLLFTPSEDANLNLKNEGTAPEKIKFTGNIMIDSLMNNIEKTNENILNEIGVVKNRYALVTLHRPSNVDEKSTLEGILEGLNVISKDIDLVFPLHPRTKSKIEEFELEAKLTENIRITEPLGYLDFLSLTKNAKIVITDSGGIQEETTALGIPCLTLRNNTERPITVEEGTNKIIGNKQERLIDEFKYILVNENKKYQIPHFWDGKTALRIADIIEKQLS